MKTNCILKKNSRRYICLLITLLIISCDTKTKVAIIKNEMKSTITGVTITGVTQTHDLIPDSVLYKEDIYMNIVIDPGQYQIVAMPDFTVSELADSTKIYLLIFNDDSLKKYRTLGTSKGIFKNSLVKKILIDKPKAKAHLDTIFIR